jgi:hypothetical protein
MDFTIYAIGMNSIRVVVLVRNPKFDFGLKILFFEMEGYSNKEICNALQVSSTNS